MPAGGKLTDGEKGSSDPCFANLKDAEEIIRKEIDLFLEFKDTFLQVVQGQTYMEIKPMDSVPVETTPLAKKTLQKMDILSQYKQLTAPFIKRRLKQRVTKEEINYAEIVNLLNSVNFEVDETKSSSMQYIALPYRQGKYTFYFKIEIFDDYLRENIWIYRNDEIIFFDSLHYFSFKSVKRKNWVDFYIYTSEQLKQAIVVQAKLLLQFKDVFLTLADIKACQK